MGMPYAIIATFNLPENEFLQRKLNLPVNHCFRRERPQQPSKRCFPTPPAKQKGPAKPGVRGNSGNSTPLASPFDKKSFTLSSPRSHTK